MDDIFELSDDALDVIIAETIMHWELVDGDWIAWCAKPGEKRYKWHQYEKEEYHPTKNMSQAMAALRRKMYFYSLGKTSVCGTHAEVEMEHCILYKHIHHKGHIAEASTTKLERSICLALILAERKGPF